MPGPGRLRSVAAGAAPCSTQPGQVVSELGPEVDQRSVAPMFGAGDTDGRPTASRAVHGTSQQAGVRAHPSQLDIVALGQHRHHQLPQRPGEAALSDHDSPLTHTDLVHGVARGRPVRRRHIWCLAKEILPAPSVGAVGSVEHPTAAVPILGYPGDLKPHPPSLTPLGYLRQHRSLRHPRQATEMG